MKLVLEAELFKSGSCSGIKLCVFCPMGEVDLVHVIHQIQSRLPPYMFVQSAAEIVGDVIFAV